MMKRMLLVLCLGIAYLAPLPAFGSERHLNISFAAGRHYESALDFDTSYGLDISYFLFTPFQGTGLVTKVSTTFADSITRMAFFIGPAFRSVLAGGVDGYASAGLSIADIENQVPGGSNELQLGLGADLGARFRFASSGSLDVALAAGILADVSLLHLLDGKRITDWAFSIVPYVGLSFSSFALYGFPSYTIY